MFQILVCYLPGRTFSIISPSVGAECSCLVSLRAKNHIWRTQFRRMYRGGSVGHMSELHRSPTQEHIQTHTHKTHTQYMASKTYTIRHFDLISNNHITFEANTNSVLLCRAKDKMKDILNQTKYVSRQSKTVKWKGHWEQMSEERNIRKKGPDFGQTVFANKKSGKRAMITTFGCQLGNKSI